MSVKKSEYLQNFIVACAGIIGLYIVFLAFDLKIFNSSYDTLMWFIILIVFIAFIITLKLIFPWMKIRDLVDGIWIGIALYCWTPILKLPWQENLINALKEASTYFVIGFIILFIGYYYRKKNN